MMWQNLLSNDRIEVRFDKSDKTAMLEVNDGGLVPSYMTIRLDVAELDELLAALREARRLMES
ncbi:hypothetical protein FE784_09530 [Paenibacillus hemerocallicola]|uniref:Uncharacterized protein n=1 Tax=Paenibacillus hemerocallicola TaxID=1172614 RepID=A0A5C4TDD3_9BACL|nr:hypothetical protein [Paenibacillus hemerocallicola]TNJ66499.1 hypothetical protein FE784_09530 [Paenibacillus hemerocallicola]